MKKKIIFYFIISLLGILFLFECTPKKDNVVHLDISKPNFEKLSEYNFFKDDIKNLSPNSGIVPYEMITPLFSDYAQKARFIYVPKGKTVAYQEEDVLDFPVGSCIIKNFFYYNDERIPSKGRRIIETRLLIHKNDGWETLPYIWNEEQTDATLQVAGGDKHVEWINKKGEKMTVEYTIPNKNQCKSCHWNKEEITPIGPKVRNINCDMVYTDGKKRNQLDMWATLGILKGLECPATSPRVAKWDDPIDPIQDRALAYLDVNCGHCHRPEGQGGTSGLTLTYTEHNTTKLGLYKSPVAAGIGSGGRLYDIVPGYPDSSIIYYRMNSTNPGVMMPELGRHLVHKEGVELIYQWIAGMDKKNPIVFVDPKTGCKIDAGK
jgi:uncharacterized repeat protein (TIGR03806 family)